MARGAGQGARARFSEAWAVTKTFAEAEILPVLRQGHRYFGENRVQEAMHKWPPLREQFPAIELHLIGPLQSNKVGEAVALFDCIETLDRPKLAAALAAEIQRQGRHRKAAYAGEYRARAAKGRRRARRCSEVSAAMPAGVRPHRERNSRASRRWRMTRCRISRYWPPCATGWGSQS